MLISKAIVFQRFAAPSSKTLAQGLAVGASLMIGSRQPKDFVLRLPADHFRHLMDRLLAGASIVLLPFGQAAPYSRWRDFPLRSRCGIGK